MSFWKWSRVAASNANADASCPFPEGMAPSAVNDGTRGMMAAAAKYRDDMAGAIVTGGIVNAYTVATYQGFGTLANLDGAAIAFTPHITSTGPVLLNIDGLGQKPYRPSPGVDFIGGELIQGTPYVGVYNHAAGEIYARGFMSSPYAVPFLGGMDFWDTVAPNSCFIFPAGQAISRTVYSRAFARWGTTYGAGDGTTTFNVPDKTGRVSAMKEAAASRLTATYFGGNSANMGAIGGGESKALATTNLPAQTPGGTVSQPTANVGGVPALAVPNTAVNTGVGAGGISVYQTSQYGALTITQPTFNGTPFPGQNATPFAVVQPTIVCNYIIRIL